MKKLKGILGQWKISKYYTGKITRKDIDKDFQKLVEDYYNVNTIKSNETAK